MRKSDKRYGMGVRNKTKMIEFKISEVNVPFEEKIQDVAMDAKCQDERVENYM